MTKRMIGRMLLGVVLIPVISYFLYTTVYQNIYHHLYGYVIWDFHPPTAFDMWSARAEDLMLFLVTPASLILWCFWCIRTRSKPVVFSRTWMIRKMVLGIALIPLVLYVAFVALVIVFALLWPPFAFADYSVPWWEKYRELIKAEWMYGIIPSSVLIWCTWCWRRPRQL